MVASARWIAAPPDAVWEVLVDAPRYPDWLVGAQRVQPPERAWPRPGASFEHEVGAGPVHVHDHTTVLYSRPPHRLDLMVRARPFLRATVRFDVRRDGLGTHVTMIERTVGPFRLLAPLIAPLVKVRNDRSLEHLAAMVEA